MAKDYAKFVPAKKRSSKKNTRGPEYFLILFLGLATIAATTFYFVSKQQPEVMASNTAKPSLVSKLVSLVHPKKDNALSANKLAAKKIAMTDPNDAPPVQFDFYSELPNMQVTLSDATPTAKPVPTPDAKLPKMTELSADDDLPAPDKTALAKPAAVKVALDKTLDVAKSPPIFNANEVTDLLDAESGHSQRFIIQLGAFESETGARRLFEAVKSVGFEVEVVRATQGTHTLYTVQQGPFESISVARSTQARMQKRGIISTIRKTA